MTTSVAIKEVAIYHPENAVHNDFYIDQFQRKGQEIGRLLQSLGRESRYIADYQKETTVTMTIEAAKEVLSKASLTGKDLDMIVFVSSTPEYFAPPNSVLIHHAIGGKQEAMVFDMNAACVGMIVAVEQASRMMEGNSMIRRALIVASEQLHRYAREDEAATYANFGDGASAVILEKEEDSLSGFMDSAYHVNTESIDKIVLPACGVSNLYDTNTLEFDKKIQWENVSNDNAFLSTVQLVEKLLNRNHLRSKDVKAFCFSQLSRKNIYKVQEALDEDLAKFPIVGTQFGYTGSASPFMALEYAVRTGQVKRGDYVVFWSVGAGTTACAMLYRY